MRSLRLGGSGADGVGTDGAGALATEVVGEVGLVPNHARLATAKPQSPIKARSPFRVLR
jgi:hypothetical protein